MKFFLMAVLICSWNELKASEITYIGMTESGTELTHNFEEKEYEQHLSETLFAFDIIVDQRTSGQIAVSGGKFSLTQIVLGLGVNGEIGIGPFKLGAGIRHRSYYKRSL